MRPFRWYWAAQWPTLLGTWMQVVALGYLVYQRTGSTTAVAAVAAADGIPSTYRRVLVRAKESTQPGWICLPDDPTPVVPSHTV